MGRYPAILDRSSEFERSGKNDAEAGWIGYFFFGRIGTQEHRRMKGSRRKWPAVNELAGTHEEA